MHRWQILSPTVWLRIKTVLTAAPVVYRRQTPSLGPARTWQASTCAHLWWEHRSRLQRILPLRTRWINANRAAMCPVGGDGSCVQRILGCASKCCSCHLTHRTFLFALQRPRVEVVRRGLQQSTPNIGDVVTAKASCCSSKHSQPTLDMCMLHLCVLARTPCSCALVWGTRPQQ